MELPPGHIEVYRKTFELLLEAESQEKAMAEFAGLVGSRPKYSGLPYTPRPPNPRRIQPWLWTWYDFFFEEVQGCVPADPPPDRQGSDLSFYAATATVAVPAETVSSTPPDEEVEGSVEWAFTWLEWRRLSADGRAFDLHRSERPAERGTMPALPADRRTLISSARILIDRIVRWDYREPRGAPPAQPR
jgi:hypothetical protein